MLSIAQTSIFRLLRQGGEFYQTMPWQPRQHGKRSQFAHTFPENLQSSRFFRSLVAIGFVPSNPHEIRLFQRFQTLTKATVGYARIADFNDSKCSCPQGHVGSNPTSSATISKSLMFCGFFRRTSNFFELSFTHYCPPKRIAVLEMLPIDQLMLPFSCRFSSYIARSVELSISVQ